MKSGATFPLMLIVLGSLWFLRSTALLPDTQTLLALLLAGAGLALLLIDGINKTTLVSSPLLVYAGGAVWLYHEAILRLSHALSLGMVLAGLLMLIARSHHIPDKSQGLGRHLP
ncbi:hypothetical protein [Craterilacuibacter sp.]|uniref:hypothetical protein n=1 Tax=Craterilacuibacter sp. TaxID=2870909 RepID=UPI003F2F323A